MRQDGRGDPQADADKEKNEAVAKQSATLRLNQARHGRISNLRAIPLRMLP
jgi:hypothetical protein